jgi:hypothetical protein
LEKPKEKRADNSSGKMSPPANDGVFLDITFSLVLRGIRSIL